MWIAVKHECLANSRAQLETGRFYLNDGLRATHKAKKWPCLDGARVLVAHPGGDCVFIFEKSMADTAADALPVDAEGEYQEMDEAFQALGAEFMHAATQSDLESMKNLLEQDIQLINLVDENGYSALVHVTAAADFEVCNLSLSSKSCFQLD